MKAFLKHCHPNPPEAEKDLAGTAGMVLYALSPIPPTRCNLQPVTCNLQPIYPHPIPNPQTHREQGTSFIRQNEVKAGNREPYPHTH